MLRRRKSNDDENLERWLLTYADLITLLLAFFIVMYSMSQVDAKKFGKISEALSGVLRGGPVVKKKGNKSGTAPGKGIIRIGQLMSVGEMVKSDLKEKGDSALVSIEMSERGLVIHIMESALFKPGLAELEPRAQQILDLVAEHLKDVSNHIRIEGHTDNIPINTNKYPSNWELSSARATEVVRYFVTNHAIPPSRISALGYGEYRPLKPNNTSENRAQNRRVDIVILTAELTAAEPKSKFYNP